MIRRSLPDALRQLGVVLSALFMVGATVYFGAGIQDAVDVGPRSPVQPAGYAFGIWAAIFALALAYAAFQALPRQQTNPLLRAIGGWTSAAFLCTGLWSVVVPRRWFDAAQALLFVAAVSLAVVYLRIAREAAARPLADGERWLVALPIAPFFGWLTAANAVSVHGRLVEWGVLPAAGPAPELAGAILVVGGGAVGAAFVRAGRRGPVQAYLVYALTFLWACVAIVVQQAGVAPLVVGAAVAAAIMVLLALVVVPGATPGFRPPVTRTA